MANSTTAFHHDRFSRVLTRFVKDGKVDYAALKQESADESTDFPLYLKELADADVSAVEKSERENVVAFWVNAYNAYTLKLIIDNYPLRSIKDLSFLGTGFINSPWKKKFCRVGGVLYSLDEIEHDILRGRLGETEVHFALVCASASCPVLRSEAYTAPDLRTQLKAQAESFLTDGIHNKLFWEGDTLKLSQIFQWYKKDFEREAGSVEKYLARYFTGEQKAKLESGAVKIEYLDYDWSLNDSKL